ncbi:hypothetical protein pb186bvf_016701 [Paramecium bursaria]
MQRRTLNRGSKSSIALQTTLDDDITSRLLEYSENDFVIDEQFAPWVGRSQNTSPSPKKKFHIRKQTLIKSPTSQNIRLFKMKTEPTQKLKQPPPRTAVEEIIQKHFINNKFQVQLPPSFEIQKTKIRFKYKQQIETTLSNQLLKGFDKKFYVNRTNFTQKQPILIVSSLFGQR